MSTHLDGWGPANQSAGPGRGVVLELFDEAQRIGLSKNVVDTADAELGLEKSQASRGLLTIQPNEPDILGYTDENADAVAAFSSGIPRCWIGTTVWKSSV